MRRGKRGATERMREGRENEEREGDEPTEGMARFLKR